MRGRVVRTLVDRPMKPGYYAILFNGRSDNGVPIGSGLYLWRATRRKAVIDVDI